MSSPHLRGAARARRGGSGPGRFERADPNRAMVFEEFEVPGHEARHRPFLAVGHESVDDDCAVCHGKEAKGNGPAAPALKKTPTDLTTISAQNGGAFPSLKVGRYLEGLDEVESHGTRDMPMWGNVFKSLDSPDTAKRRVFVLMEYLKTLQAK